MTKPITASDRFVSDRQLDAQEALIDIEIIRLEMQMSGQSTEEVWVFKGQLTAIKKGIMDARKALHLLPVKRKKLWDRLRIRIYLWSIQDRFK